MERPFLCGVLLQDWQNWRKKGKEKVLPVQLFLCSGSWTVTFISVCYCCVVHLVPPRFSLLLPVTTLTFFSLLPSAFPFVWPQMVGRGESVVYCNPYQRMGWERVAACRDYWLLRERERKTKSAMGNRSWKAVLDLWSSWTNAYWLCCLPSPCLKVPASTDIHPHHIWCACLSFR